MKKSKTVKSKATASAATGAKKGGAKAPTPAKAATKKAAKPSKPKKVSALDAAAQVLSKADKPMRAQELIGAMADGGLWKSPGGKTPHATLYAAMLREINAKGKAARFTKSDRGLFEISKAGA